MGSVLTGRDRKDALRRLLNRVTFSRHCSHTSLTSFPPVTESHLVNAQKLFSLEVWYCSNMLNEAVKLYFTKAPCCWMYINNLNIFLVLCFQFMCLDMKCSQINVLNGHDQWFEANFDLNIPWQLTKTLSECFNGSSGDYQRKKINSSSQSGRHCWITDCQLPQTFQLNFKIPPSQSTPSQQCAIVTEPICIKTLNWFVKRSSESLYYPKEDFDGFTTSYVESRADVPLLWG